MTCSWLLAAPDGQFLTLYFHGFHTECGWDYLAVYEAGPSNGAGLPLVGVYSGAFAPDPIASVSGSLLLTFVSDEAVSADGFELEYVMSPCPYNCHYRGSCNTTSDSPLPVCDCDPGFMGVFCQHVAPASESIHESSVWGRFAPGSPVCNPYLCTGPSSVLLNASAVLDVVSPGDLALWSRALPEPCYSFPALTNASRLGECKSHRGFWTDGFVRGPSLTEPVLPHRDLLDDYIHFLPPAFDETADANWLVVNCAPTVPLPPPGQLSSLTTLFFAIIMMLSFLCACLVGVHLVTTRGIDNRIAMIRTAYALALARQRAPVPHTAWFTCPVRQLGPDPLAAPDTEPPAPIPVFEFDSDGDVARAIEFVVLRAPGDAPSASLHTILDHIVIATKIRSPSESSSASESPSPTEPSSASESRSFDSADSIDSIDALVSLDTAIQDVPATTALLST